MTKFSMNLLSSIDELMLAIKQKCYSVMQLQQGHRVLDAGCGLGYDAARIALSIEDLGQVCGLDICMDTLERAKMNNCSPISCFIVANVPNIPFRDNVFDVIWSDRLLQHLDTPQLAIREMLRVTKSGAKIVLADSDHYSATISCPDTSLAQTLMRYRASKFKSGNAGASLSKWCRKAGVLEIEVEKIEIAVKNLSASKKVGLFFGDWHREYEASSVSNKISFKLFRDGIKQMDLLDNFFYRSNFYVVSGITP